MRNNILIILSLLVVVVGQISEETASQRTNIKLSFGQANTFGNSKKFFFVFCYKSTSVSGSFTGKFNVNVNKNGVSKYTNVDCDLSGQNTIGKRGIGLVQFQCVLDSAYDSVEISSSENIAGIPFVKDLLSPITTDKLSKDGKLTLVSFNSEVPQILGNLVIDYTNARKGLLELTVTLKQTDAKIKQGQLFEIHLLYPEGIILKFNITEINGLNMKLKCEVNGEVIQQRLYVEQTVILIDGNYLFVLPGFQTEIITINEDVFQNEEEEEEETDKEQKLEKEEEQLLETENEQKRKSEGTS